MKKIVRKILKIRNLIGGYNPYFNFFHHQYLAVRDLNTFIKKDFSEFADNVKILDYGCGSKPYEKFVQTSDYIGVDIKSGDKVDIVVNIGDKLPFNDKYFDFIISTNVLEHIEDLDFILKEFDRVLSEDGRAYVSVPFMFEEHASPYDFRRFTEEGLKLLFNADKFEVVKSQKIGRFGTVVIVMINNWIDKQLTNFKIFNLKVGIIIKIVTLPIYFPVIFFMNLFGLFLNYIDMSASLYSSSIVVYKKNK